MRHECAVYIFIATSVMACSSSPTSPAPPSGSSSDAAALDGSATSDASPADAGLDGATCVPAVCITLPESGGRCASGENMAACAKDKGDPCAPDPSCTRAANQTGGDSTYFCCVD